MEVPGLEPGGLEALRCWRPSVLARRSVACAAAAGLAIAAVLVMMDWHMSSSRAAMPLG
jgi:hypothetical protein